MNRNDKTKRAYGSNQNKYQGAPEMIKKSKMKSSHRATLLVVAGALAVGASVRAATTLLYCGYQNLDIVMEQVPTSWSAYDDNNDAMWMYNQWMDIFRYTADDGTWGDNGDNEFGGFPTSSQLMSTWGFGWSSSDIGATVFNWSCECCRLKETDVVFNAAKTFTYSRSAAEYSSSYYYHSVLLHELGHVWGMQTKNETYNYDDPTVMHAYSNDVVQDYLQLHKPEAYLIRRSYDRDLSIPSMENMSVTSKYADGNWEPTTTDRYKYFQGSDLDIYDLTVENTGTRDLSDVRLRIYLSTNRTISTSDHLCGEWTWSSFNDESWWTGDLIGNTIPSDVCGDFWVGALVTHDGYSGDDHSYDDTTYLIDKIHVTCLVAIPIPRVLIFEPWPIPLWSSALSQAQADGLVGEITVVQERGELRELLESQPWDMVVLQESLGGQSDIYEQQLIDHIRKGGKTIISDPRTDDDSARRIMRAAGARYTDRTNYFQLSPLETAGEVMFDLHPQSDVWSWGIESREGAGVFARFEGMPPTESTVPQGGEDGDQAIVGIGGRTLVLGFSADALPDDGQAVDFLTRQIQSLAVGRQDEQARVSYSIVPASWSEDGQGNVVGLELFNDRQLEISPAGGTVNYAVLVDVEDTDSEGLAMAGFDVQTSSESAVLTPLNLGVRYRDPDMKTINIGGVPTPIPAVRPIVNQGGPVGILNSVFTGPWSGGQPTPGILKDVFITMNVDGPPQAMTRGVGFMGNQLQQGARTVIGVGKIVIPPGNENISVGIANAAGSVLELDPFSLEEGGGAPVYEGEQTDMVGLSIVRPASYDDHGDETPEELTETPDIVFGDCDNDGDVDLVDFGQFQLCFSGSGAPIAAGCECADSDADGDADLVDFGAFQLAFTGS